MVRRLLLCAMVLLGSARITAAPAADEAQLREFARCLSSKGAVMYAAFWCDHCRQQKELFGPAAEHLMYVECGVVGNPRAQTAACANKQIRKYPTWEFADGERRTGKQSLETLAEKTGCKLP